MPRRRIDVHQEDLAGFYFDTAMSTSPAAHVDLAAEGRAHR
jgi:hypothetical protein